MSKRYKLKVVVVSGDSVPASRSYVSCALIDSDEDRVWRRLYLYLYVLCFPCHICTLYYPLVPAKSVLYYAKIGPWNHQIYGEDAPWRIV
eukprot:971020-Amorphochlora_amoeboformis.AAC.2